MIYRASFGTPFWRMRSPFSEFESLRRQMDNFMDTFSGRVADSAGAGVFPLINLTENKDNYYIRAELPGVITDDLDVKVTENTLTISGMRKIATESEEARYHRREREAGKFSRAISMPGNIESDRVEASLVNGVLTVVVPKAAKSKPRQIVIS
jgi:HSP20 family protein